MSSVSIPVHADPPQIRALNMFRDLSQVADLIELCFADSMDRDGQRYISDMRRASQDASFMHWATQMANTASLPVTGFVWEEDHRIVGNASLIPFRDKGRRIYLIANIAVHPEYRRQGVARLLTRRAMEYGWQKKASALWLHVRDDNPGAVALYNELGFNEIARRTTWTAKPDPLLPKNESEIEIVSRHARFWQQQQEWLRRIHPDPLNWYRSINLASLRPGLLNWLYLLFVDMHIRQWAAVRKDVLLATLSWAPNGGRSGSLLAATGPGSEPEALTQLLIHARRTFSHHNSLTLDHPFGEMRDAFLEAGFKEYRTLLWMRALPATSSR